MRFGRRMRRVLTPALVLISLLSCRSQVRAPSVPRAVDTRPLVLSLSCAATVAEIQEARTLAAAGKLLRARQRLALRKGSPADEPSCLAALLEIADTLGDEKTLIAVSVRAASIALPRDFLSRVSSAEKRWAISGPLDSTIKTKSAGAFAAGLEAERGGKRAAALDNYLEAAKLRHPHPAGQALALAGELARSIGKLELSQSLYDRAVIALERETGAPMRLATHHPLPCTHGGPAVFKIESFSWLPHGEYLAVGCDTLVEIEDVEKLRPLARYDGATTPREMDSTEAPALILKPAVVPEAAPESSSDPSVHESATVLSHDHKMRVTAGWNEVDTPSGKTSIRPTIEFLSAEGQLLRRVPGPSLPVGLLRFSTDDTEVTGYVLLHVPFDGFGPGLWPWEYDGTGIAHTWSTKTGALLRTMKNAPLLSVDGKWTSSVRRGTKGRVELRQVAGKSTRVFDTGDDLVRQVSLSPSGRFLALLAHRDNGGPPEDEQPRIWSVVTGLEVTPPHLRAWREKRDLPEPQEIVLNNEKYARRGAVLWKLTEPAERLRYYVHRVMSSYHSLRSISAVKWANEDVDFERDEAEPFSCVAEGAGPSCRIFDPRGPIVIANAANAEAEVHCRVGTYRFPLAVCLDAFTASAHE